MKTGMVRFCLACCDPAKGDKRSVDIDIEAPFRNRRKTQDEERQSKPSPYTCKEAKWREKDDPNLSERRMWGRVTTHYACSVPDSCLSGETEQGLQLKFGRNMSKQDAGKIHQHFGPSVEVCANLIPDHSNRPTHPELLTVLRSTLTNFKVWMWYMWYHMNSYDMLSSFKHGMVGNLSMDAISSSNSSSRKPVASLPISFFFLQNADKFFPFANAFKIFLLALQAPRLIK